jgi:Concanavalin A-like lectin/glucanases superfamily
VAIRFDAGTDQLLTDGWGGSVATLLCWWRLTVSADSQTLYQVTPNAGGGGGTRLLLQTSGTTNMVLFDQSLSETQAAGNPGVNVWYCHAVVVNGNDFTVYHGLTPGALTTVGPTVRQGFTAPGALLLSLAAEPLQSGDIANLKVWNRALSLADVQAELATYAVVNATNLIRRHNFHAVSLANEQGTGAPFTAGATAVSVVDGPAGVTLQSTTGAGVATFGALAGTGAGTVTRVGSGVAPFTGLVATGAGAIEYVGSGEAVFAELIALGIGIDPPPTDLPLRAGPPTIEQGLHAGPPAIAQGFRAGNPVIV